MIFIFSVVSAILLAVFVNVIPFCMIFVQES